MQGAEKKTNGIDVDRNFNSLAINQSFASTKENMHKNALYFCRFTTKLKWLHSFLLTNTLKKYIIQLV